MHSTIFSIAAFAALTVASPTKRATDGGINLPAGINLGDLVGSVSNSPPTFSNLTCKIDQALIPGQPLHQLFPLTNALGARIGPILGKALGNDTVNNIDAAADEFCVSAEQAPDEGDGACQFLLGAINSFVTEDSLTAPVADKYRCLLNFLCVAPVDFDHPGTCQTLLAGVDCNANRLVGVGDKECDGKVGK